MGGTKGPEKKGTTKARRHKVFLGLPQLREQTKKASFVPSCLCGSRLLCFCGHGYNDGIDLAAAFTWKFRDCSQVVEGTLTVNEKIAYGISVRCD